MRERVFRPPQLPARNFAAEAEEKPPLQEDQFEGFAISREPGSTFKTSSILRHDGCDEKCRCFRAALQTYWCLVENGLRDFGTAISPSKCC